MDFATMMALEPHGTDVWVGTGPQYPWGGLYGGQIVAQSLRAGTFTVDPVYRVHSLHAYFVRTGDSNEPIRFEVDRVRNGRSFCTRRVTARQSVGVILEMTASFQIDEDAPTAQTALMPAATAPDALTDDAWSTMFDRRSLPGGRGESAAWMRMAEPVGEDRALQACALAYLSDDLPTEAVVRLHPELDRGGPLDGQFMSASLDHAVYLHRPAVADAWHLQTFTCHGLMSSRGVSVGYLFTEDGTHMATVVQEVLLRTRRPR
ncbi:MAG TPA: acyl-CoA thioesterase domain-containing protein [Acidimicrobiales bacterium]|nr:acyl-CoA thioesterase domain-containing protein [Acidimicrobiales bacterium]